MKRLILPLCFLFVLLPLWSQPAARPVPRITRVEVRSRVPGREVRKEPVLAFVQPVAGDIYDPKVVNLDVRRLQETGRYAYVGAEALPERNGLALIFVVEERPRLRSFTVTGAEHFSNTRVRNWIEIQLGDRVDIGKVEGELEKVREKYRKAFYPEVGLDVQLGETDEDGFADLTLVVEEGPRLRVKQIEFEGNTEFTRAQLLKAMQQKKTGLLSFITKRGRLLEDQLRQDMLTIEDLYRRKGYLDAKVGPPSIEENDRGGLTVTIPIEPYTPYRIRSFRIEGNTLYPVSLLGAQVPLQVSGPAASDKMEAGRRGIRDFYNSRGYSDTRVNQQVLLVPGTQELDVIYQVKEGRIEKIRSVLIRGNTRTKDHVLRRELLVEPGQILNEVQLRTSTRRLQNLSFVELANHALLPTEDPDQVDVEFDITEGRSGTFLAGIGFSSVDSLVGFVEVSQTNFDLFGPPSFTGAGDKLRLRLSLGTERRDSELIYTKPWLFDRRLTLNATAFQNDRQFLSDDYDQRNTGFSVGLRKALWGLWRGGLTYTLEEIDVYNVSEDASQSIQDEEGKNTRSGLEYRMTRDSRNHVFEPTKGGRVVLNAGFTGGPLGFDTEIYNMGARSSYYYPIVLDHVLNVQGWARFVDSYGDSDSVPIFDRYFLGGARTIRGFEFRDVSPVDDEGDPIGGQSALFAMIEYNIPINDTLSYALFYDWGVVNADAYDVSVEDANSSYGIGLRVSIPGFPLRLDYSFQHLNNEFNEESGGKFSFLIGYSY